MRSPRRRRRGRALSRLCLALSAAVAAASTWKALAPPAAAVPPAVQGAESGFAPVPTPAPLDRVLAVVAVDPFHAERTGPKRRFGAVQAEPVDPSPGGLRLAGTGLLPQAVDFVLAGFGSEPPRIVRVGESIGVYRLITVRAGEADFRVAGPDGERITLTVVRPGS